MVGIDEHVWRHTRRGDWCVTVVIDLTPIRDGPGPGLPQRRRITGATRRSCRAICGAQTP
ncbi:hypothetical protein GGQ22_19820 [Nocardioides sp. zg-579]|uniref:Transposase n=1 Tax=Nocardioides marmotae TaxID=2663857 RepID=A0A6I3JHB6_9ACTN|nr:hypothetical protein [Gordonia jinghuaiqii]MTB97318.1 hypothetical protein [Nocardioides marmotae]